MPYPSYFPLISYTTPYLGVIGHLHERPRYEHIGKWPLCLVKFTLYDTTNLHHAILVHYYQIEQPRFPFQEGDLVSLLGRQRTCQAYFTDYNQKDPIFTCFLLQKREKKMLLL